MTAAASPASSPALAGTPRGGSGIAILWVTIVGGDGRAVARAVDRFARSAVCSRRTTAAFTRLHHRLLAAGDEARAGVEAAIAALLRTELVAQLRGWCGPCADRDDLIDMAVDDALGRYFEQPARYVPGRGETTAWFVTVAQHKLLDALRAQRRRCSRERPAGVDADLERTVPATALLPGGDAEARDARTAELLERLMPFAWTDGERRYLRVKFGGGSVAEQAAALGVAGRQVAEQQAATRAAWHRIKERGVRATGIASREPGRRVDRSLCDPPPLRSSVPMGGAARTRSIQSRVGAWPASESEDRNYDV